MAETQTHKVIDQDLVDKLQLFVNGTVPGAGGKEEIHAVVVMYKGRALDLYITPGAPLKELPGDYEQVETRALVRADYASVIVFQDLAGKDPYWYFMNGRRYHTP